MALIVENGTVVAGAESYVSVADATTYHANRGNSLWAGVDSVKEAALRKATSYLDGHYINRWKGVRTANGQALQWPRQWVLQYAVDARNGWAGNPVYVESNIIPQFVKDATCECALRFLTGDMNPDLDSGGRLTSIKIGPISQSFSPGSIARTSYPQIDMLLTTLLTNVNTVELVRS